MAFAPPRRVKADESTAKPRRPLGTRLPVASPSKKKDEPIPGSSIHNAVKHQSRVIPSRYAQTAVVKSRTPADSSGTSGKLPSAVRSQHTALKIPAREGAIGLESPKKLPQVTRANQAHKNEQSGDEHLSLRLLQIIQICQEGEKAFAEYKLSAQTQLTAKWEAIMEQRKAYDLHISAKQTRDTLAELQTLSESDLLMLENFIHRMERLEDTSLSSSQEFDDWSQNVRKPISSAWQSNLQSQLSDVLSIKQSTDKLVKQILQSPTRGNVFYAIEALTKYLDDLELELKDLSMLAAQLWQNRIAEIEKDFNALNIGTPEARQPYVWDIR